MNLLFDSIFKYGYHDSVLSCIEIQSESVILIFEDGVWNLDNDGKEISKTRSVQLIINLNMMYISTPLDAFEIYTIGKSSRYLDIDDLIGGKISFKISNVFFSKFNNTLLIVIVNIFM